MGIPEWGLLDLLSSLYLSFSGNSDVTKNFEKYLQSLIDVKSVILTDLGRQAIYLALETLFLRPSDEVILPSYACPNVILPVISAGAKPVFADCATDLNISINHVKSLINSNTRAIIVPHIYGTFSKIKEFSELADKEGVILIDDAAQVFGAKIEGRYLGTFGTFGIFSFGPFKNVMATKGGALIDCRKNGNAFPTNIRSNNNFKNSVGIAFKSWLKFKLRKHTYPLLNIRSQSKKNQRSHDPGFNLTETYPAAMSGLDSGLLIKLISKTDAIIKKRIDLAKELTALIEEKNQFFLPEIKDNIFVKYIIRLKDGSHFERAGFLSYLRENGIEAHEGYYPLHLQENFSQFRSGSALPFTEGIWDKVICLPVHSSMETIQIKYMAGIINSYKWGYNRGNRAC